MFGVPSSFQVWTFVKSAGLGVLTGAAYFLFMALRSLTPGRKLPVAVQDAAFFIGVFLVTFLFTFETRAGAPRLYVFIGVGAGFCLFYALPARAFRSRLQSAAARLREQRSRRRQKRRSKREKEQKKQKKS